MQANVTGCASDRHIQVVERVEELEIIGELRLERSRIHANGLRKLRVRVNDSIDEAAEEAPLRILRQHGGLRPLILLLCGQHLNLFYSFSTCRGCQPTIRRV